jgi:hypothetical protein
VLTSPNRVARIQAHNGDITPPFQTFPEGDRGVAAWIAGRSEHRAVPEVRNRRIGDFYRARVGPSASEATRYLPAGCSGDGSSKTTGDNVVLAVESTSKTTIATNVLFIFILLPST